MYCLCFWRSQQTIDQIYCPVSFRIFSPPHYSNSSFFFVQKFNFDFLRKLSGFFWLKNSWKVVVLDFLAVDNFDFTRKIAKKILCEKLVKMLGLCQNWIFGQKFDFLNSVPPVIFIFFNMCFFQLKCQQREYCWCPCRSQESARKSGWLHSKGHWATRQADLGGVFVRATIAFANRGRSSQSDRWIWGGGIEHSCQSRYKARQ